MVLNVRPSSCMFHLLSYILDSVKYRIGGVHCTFSSNIMKTNLNPTIYVKQRDHHMNISTRHKTWIVLSATAFN
jgi:hypothetical protein